MKITLLLIALFPLPLYADPVVGCHTPEVAVYFGNGMFNDKYEANNSRRALQKMIWTAGLPKTEVQFAYNLNEPALEELLQVATQKSEEYGRMFWRYLSDLSLAPGEFRQFARDIAKKFDQTRYVHDADLRGHISSYQSEVKAGKSILIVAHSQGNFYANAAWNILSEEKSSASKISIVGVAAPVSEIAGDGDYTTLTQDLIIAAVRSTVGALPANVTNAKSSSSGHEFISQYLDGNPSGPKILSDIKKAIQQRQKSVTAPVDLSDSNYVHPSLIPFWQYVGRIQDSTAKFTDSECLAISSFAKTYDWWGESCEERSLPALIKWMNACSKEWSEKDRFDFGRCSLLGDGSFIDPGLESTPAFGFILVAHPECIWHEDEVRRRITPDVFIQAQTWLKTPPTAR